MTTLCAPHCCVPLWLRLGAGERHSIRRRTGIDSVVATGGRAACNRSQPECDRPRHTSLPSPGLVRAQATVAAPASLVTSRHHRRRSRASDGRNLAGQPCMDHRGRAPPNGRGRYQHGRGAKEGRWPCDMAAWRQVASLPCAPRAEASATR